MFTHAIARKPGPNFAQGLTTAFNEEPPKYETLVNQHEEYIFTLKSIGIEVILLDALPDHPDAYFVEDTAVVAAEVAVITNPGADARKGEEATIAPVLAQYRKTERIRPPGTVDGGDVLQVDRHFFIGVSERTNPEGAGQLSHILGKYGYTCTMVTVGEGLHFKSSVNYVGKNTLLITEDFAGNAQFEGYDALFGPQDYCKCNHCQSIISPAAYFVDLMDFLDQRRTFLKSGLKLFHHPFAMQRDADAGAEAFEEMN